ncbi:unnamed protein product [Linum trigynum]|uniref:Uncharacterized protein n=1 Tax=Linum trigynum TaxID=586398 RepID=A0AAV2GCP0_9ROSI
MLSIPPTRRRRGQPTSSAFSSASAPIAGVSSTVAGADDSIAAAPSSAHVTVAASWHGGVDLLSLAMASFSSRAAY